MILKNWRPIAILIESYISEKTAFQTVH